MGPSPDAKLCVDFAAIADNETRVIIQPEAFRIGIVGYPAEAYCWPEFQQRRDADRFLAILRKRGWDTVRAFDEVSDDEVSRIIAEEITRW